MRVNSVSVTLDDEPIEVTIDPAILDDEWTYVTIWQGIATVSLHLSHQQIREITSALEKTVAILDGAGRD